MNYAQATARCWAEIDLNIIEANHAAAQAICGNNVQIIPVLKANAYGLGAAKLSQILAQNGAELFATADLYEAIELTRACGKPALVLGMTAPAQLELAVRKGAVVTLFSAAMAENLSATAARLDKTARAHIKIDTGLHRLGLDWDRAADRAAQIIALPNIRVEGLFTHLALRNGDEDARQIARLKAVADSLRARGLDYGLLHAADSIGMVRYPEYRFDAVRAGAWLYGVVPRACPQPELCQAPARFMARIAQIRRVARGECLGYDENHPLERDSTIATISAGYADGYFRVNSIGEVEIRGRRAPVAGLVCMDQFTVDVTGIPDAREGDEVVLLGGGITYAEYSAFTGANRNEALARIGRRVPRVYLRNGTVEEIAGGMGW